MATKKFNPHYKKVADIVRARILNGDYALKAIPSERRLATEMGVNHMTVRRGMQMLEDEALLVRGSNGRLRVKKLQHGKKEHLNLAFMMPTMASQALEVWRWAIEQATRSLPCTVRSLLYMHWDDPILIDSLEGFDGVFLSPTPEPLPEEIARRLRDPKHLVIVVDDDFSAHGIPSIQIFPPVFFQRLLDHLESLGHTCIGCLNTQPNNSEIQSRMNQWCYWMSAHGFKGRLLDHGVAVHGDPTMQGYQVMNAILSQSNNPETAWFCTTTPSAIGAIAAMHDHGIRPGHDIAICAANSEGLASMSIPPITTLETPDPTPFLSFCLDRMMSGVTRWQGPLLMQPPHVPLAIRDSTKPGSGRGFPALPKVPVDPFGPIP